MKVISKNLNFFTMIRNKNVVEFISQHQININNEKEFTNDEILFYENIKMMPYLKSITLTFIDSKARALPIKFQNLTKSRLELIIDTVLKKGDFRDLMTITDNVETFDEDPYFCLRVKNNYNDYI